MAALLGAALCTLPATAARYYVSPTGGGDGSSWTSTTTLQDALAKATAGDEIWALQGIYRATEDLRSTGFTIPSGVKLYGGFKGDETDTDGRRWHNCRYRFENPSVLTGDIESNDMVDTDHKLFPGNETLTDNAIHVVTLQCGGTNEATRLDGFSVARGFAPDGGRGGGIFVTGTGGYEVMHCYLHDNYAHEGGAIYVETGAGNATSRIMHCALFNNAAHTPSSQENHGGGLYIAGRGRLIGCIVTDNENGGALISAETSVYESLICRNSAAGVETTVAATQAQVFNTVIWGNTTMHSGFAHAPIYQYCAYPGADGNGGNINLMNDHNNGPTDCPRFTNPSPYIGYDLEHATWLEEYPVWDWSISDESAMVDKGSSYAGVNPEATDMNGNPRVSNGTQDIGPFEYQKTPADRILYVKQGGTGNGTSWADAMGDIQQAIDRLAGTGFRGELGEVWVAKGTYSPSTNIISGNQYTTCFHMRDGISLYGGFEGVEGETKETRKMKEGGMPWNFEHETILQGYDYIRNVQWNANDHRWSIGQTNSYHVVWFAPMLEGEPAFSHLTVLDGFTIRGGNAAEEYPDGKTFSPDKGGGVYMEGTGRQTLRRCIIKENLALAHGGGVYCSGGRIESCLIHNNSAYNGHGGGVYMHENCFMLRSMVANNSANNGGGVYMDNADGNDANSLILSVSTVTNNFSSYNGGVYLNKGGHVLQSTIANNETPRATDLAMSDASQTGGLYIDTYGLVINTVLWNNVVNGNRIPLYAKNASNTRVRLLNCAVANVNSVIWNNIYQESTLELSETNNPGPGEISPNWSTGGDVMTDDNALNTKVGVQPGITELKYFWRPITGSNLRARGLTLQSFPNEVSVRPEMDITLTPFNLKPAIGPYGISGHTLKPEVDGNTLRLYMDQENTDPESDGSSWDKACRSLNEAISHFAGMTADEITGKTLEIYVKENAALYPHYYYVTNDPKSSTMMVPKTATGQAIHIIGGWSERDGYATYDPVNHRTVVNGNPTGSDIHNGLYHCFTVAEGAAVELRGIHIVNGNATQTAVRSFGAGLMAYEGAKVTLRDCAFENLTGETHAAIDARGSELEMVNCVVNNCTNTDATSTLINAQRLDMNHVTVANNIGTAPTPSGTAVTIRNSFAAGNTDGNTLTDLKTMGADGAKNFENPTNVQGATLGFNTYIGGYTSFRPLTGSPETAALINQGLTTTGLDADIAGNSRDLGGVPDLGAFEADLPKSGAVYYVRTTADGGNDNNNGLSWNTAFATIRKAVNTAKNKTLANGTHPQVWVAAGTYRQDPTYVSGTTTTSPNCFVIEDGVNVYGAFPNKASGILSPGMGDRHPFISDKIYHDKTYKAEHYETILTPATATTSRSTTRRVLGQEDVYNPFYNKTEGSGQKDFQYATVWDGFTLTGGYIDSYSLKCIKHGTGTRNGGAGANLYKNMTLRNCIVYNNINSSRSVWNNSKWNYTYTYFGGGGDQLRGGGVYCDQGTLMNCYIMNNTLGQTNQYTAYGAGGYLYSGTAYNCVVTGNNGIGQHTDGAGFFIENGQFYNNTVVDNTSEGTNRGNGGICIYTDENSESVNGLDVYNCISVGNTGFLGLLGDKNYANIGGNSKMRCYNSITETLPNNNQYGSGSQYIKFTDCQTGTTAMFENLDSGNYRLKAGAVALNMGLETIEIYNNIIHLSEYTDMDYTDRVKDCTIDAGAYERTNQDMVSPEKGSDGTLYYYVTFNGHGLANADSPKNAACAMKLQEVLNKAGKDVEEANYTVQAVVKVAGYESDKVIYHPHTPADPDNPMSYTYVVPEGVTLAGGFYEGTWSGNTNNNADWTMTRDITVHRTILSAISDGAGGRQTVNGYHTVTFGSGNGTAALAHEAIVDGCYIQDGQATSMAGPGNPDTRGGGAIVPAGAHVRNCIIRGCSAVEGGALYMLPGGMVSGCLIKDNTAETGGGIYVSNAGISTDTETEENRAHIISCTVVANTATGTGGGFYVKDGGGLTLNTVIWGNTAPSDKNCSSAMNLRFKDKMFGTVDERTNTVGFYPFNHCYVETYELPSNYINASMASDADLYFLNTDLYIPRAFCPLIKGGATIYWQDNLEKYGLAHLDLRNISRLADKEAGDPQLTLDAGAYARLGGSIKIPEKESDIIKRLFVSQAANVVLTEEEFKKGLYYYQGRSFHTAMSNLSDALEYIETVRKSDIPNAKAINFEIFMASGTYKPSRECTDVLTLLPDIPYQRRYTFTIPEGVKVYGGFKGTEPYAYGLTKLENVAGELTDVSAEDYDVNGQILAGREFNDLNGNGIKEPWELAHQTILSGAINVLEDARNVFHVIYSYADKNDAGRGVLLDGLTIMEGETYNNLSPTGEGSGNVINRMELGRGGGIFSKYVSYTLNRCRLQSNKAVRGNAVYMRNAQLKMMGCYLAGNSSVSNAPEDDAFGGAVFLSAEGADAPTVEVHSMNSLWTNNETAGAGGIIATRLDEHATNDKTPGVYLLNNTVARNRAKTMAAVQTDKGVITNTLLWGNASTEPEDGSDLSGTLTVNYSAGDRFQPDNDRHNIRLSTANMAVDGPRFMRPSATAGAAGFNSSNDWSLAAISCLTDAGNTVLAANETDITKATGVDKLPTDIKHYAAVAAEYYPDYQTQYMEDATYQRYAGPKDENNEPMPRIIDIGLYEYQYKDILADTVYVVADYERGDGSGKDWQNATSDLRGAIIALAQPQKAETTNMTTHKAIFIRKGEYDIAIAQLFADRTAYKLYMKTNEGTEDLLTATLDIRGSYNNQNRQDFTQPTVITTNPVNKAATLFDINAADKRVMVEGIRFVNEHGRAIVARASKGGQVVLKNIGVRKTGTDKPDATTPIEGITIAKGNAGDILLVNTVLADNAGTGLYIGSRGEGDNTDGGGKVTVVNGTFAQNGTDFNNTTSQTLKIYNTVSWNNTTSTLTTDDESHHNKNLGTAENTDLLQGPNFVDPYNTDVLGRDYRLRPSQQLLNKGADTLYTEHVKNYRPVYTDADKKNEDSSGKEEEQEIRQKAETDAAGNVTAEAETDAASSLRFVDTSIDIGAYEYAVPLREIIYVKAGLAGGKADGSSWADATADLQGAVDLATLYRESQKTDGYVLVHRNVQGAPIDVKLPGAKIYGQMADETTRLGEAATGQEIVTDLLDQRGAMMESDIHSTLTGVTLRQNADAVVDGFYVDGDANVQAGMLSSSVVMPGHTTKVSETGILYNSFVDGDITASGSSEVVNVTATGEITANEDFMFHNRSQSTEPPAVNAYITSDVWKYQLNEKSTDIDVDNETGYTLDTYITKAGHGRDLAGNPRRHTSNLTDRGCFETWNVPEGETWTTADDGHRYPVNGSVVYLHEGANLVLEQTAHTFRPGYTLLKEGASLYGNAANVSLPYVAVERTLHSGWNLVGLPYAQTRALIQGTAYGTTNGGAPTLTALHETDSMETYNGAARANALNRWYPDNSPFWSTALSASTHQGFAVKVDTEGLYRFTGGSEDNTGDAYTETADAKTVSLTQHDMRIVGTDHSPNFTYKENMGWNLFGLPYLVSHYEWEKMNVPHIIYTYDNANGQYTTLQSWATDGKKASVGDGVFTQTAILDNTETLSFPKPKYIADTESGVNRNLYDLTLTGDTGEDRFSFATTTETTDEEYVLGSDGLKLMATRADVPQVFAVNTAGTHFSLMSTVGRDRNVTVGVRAVPGSSCALGLGDTAERDDADEVWLKDTATGRSVNLRTTDYLFTAGEDDGTRFVLSFSRHSDGTAPLSIYTQGRTLCIDGLDEGETVNIYDTTGRRTACERTTGGSFRHALTRGVWLVNTSSMETARKVIIR